MRRCTAGDRPAFGVIVIRYEGLVRALAYSACGDRVRSEDIAQEAFVTAWQRLGDLRDAGKFRSWLCSITRRAARLARGTGRGGPKVMPSRWRNCPKHRIPRQRRMNPDAARRGELVWEMLERLPLPCREVLVLFYREEHSAEGSQRNSASAERFDSVWSGAGQCCATGSPIWWNPHSGAADVPAAPWLLPRWPRCRAAGVPMRPGIFTSLSTHIAAMTKIQAAAAGIVLAALAGAPFILQQHNTIAKLRAEVSARSAHGCVTIPPKAPRRQPKPARRTGHAP